MERKAVLKIKLTLIACLFLFVPAYADYEVLTELDFLSDTVKFETRDLEDYPVDKQLNVTMDSSPFPSSFSLPENRDVFFFNLPSEFSLSYESIHLRC